MPIYGPWFQPPDVEVSINSVIRYATHFANATWAVAQSFGGPHPYDDPAAGNCAWSLARGASLDYPGLEISGWSGDLSLSGYVDPPACPVVGPSTATLRGNDGGGITESDTYATVGVQYSAQNPLIFGGSEVRWSTWAVNWGISLKKTAWLYAAPSLPIPAGVSGVERDFSGGQFGTVSGVKVKATLRSGSAGLDPCPLQLYAFANSDTPPTWGPYSYGDVGFGQLWQAGNPAPPGTLIATSGGYSDTALVDVPSGLLGPAVAYESTYDPLYSERMAPYGLMILGMSGDTLSTTQPAFPGRPSLPDTAYTEVKWTGTRTWSLDGTVTIRPVPARYIYNTIPPLRWRQRDDGLGMAGAGRVRSGSSVQKSLRHRGYR